MSEGVNLICINCRLYPSGQIPARFVAVLPKIEHKESNLARSIQNKKDIRLDVLFVLLFVYTLYINCQKRNRPDLLHFCLMQKS